MSVFEARATAMVDIGLTNAEKKISRVMHGLLRRRLCLRNIDSW